ncbi:MAG: tetratricopeptide repeat protein [Chloroflexota bacterium]
MLVAGLAVSGLGNKAVARLLLNAGTADLNRGSLSETIRRDDRAVALDRASTLLRMAASFDPDDLTIQRNLALALATTDDARRARSVADRAKALTPTTSKADLFQLGRAYVAVSAWSEAIRAWQAAEAAPQLIQLGNRLIRVRNFEQAVNAFVATARVDPRSRGAYEGIARAASEAKKSDDETIEALGPLMAAGSPTELGARLQAARVLRDAGRLGDASGQLRRAEQISAPPELSFEYGMVWLAAGVPSQAEPLLIRPAADLPYDPDSWLWLARAQAERGKYAEAVETVRTGLSKIDPSGQFAPPSERLPETAAVRAAEIKRSERAPMLGVMGESLIRLGRASEAIPPLEEAVAALPKDPWLAHTLAEARAVAGGAPPNLLLNGSFDRDGSWAYRTPNWSDHLTLDTLLNEVPTIEGGQTKLVQVAPESRLLTQEVEALDPASHYLVTVRLRAEGLGVGTVAVQVRSSNLQVLSERTVSSDEAAQWQTVSLDAQPDASGDSLWVAVGFGPGAPPGAVIWCDEVTLIRQSASH